MRPFVLALVAALAAAAAPAALAQPTSGQGALAGTVADAATGVPLPAATVALYRTADSTFVTGVSTGADGAFAFEGLAAGGYRVRASFVGYGVVRRDTVVAAGPVALGRLALVPASDTLGAAVVVGEREAIELLADRTVYNVGDQPVTAGGTALDVLQTLPSVTVDTNGSVALRGNGDVAIHVNGRPVPVQGTLLAAYLRQISASQIASVQVIPNPSARYDPEGIGGIIDLVLVEEAPDRGLSGALTVGGGTAPAGELGGAVSLQRGPVDATLTYGFRADTFDLTGTTDRDVAAVAPGTPLYAAYSEGFTTRSHFGTLGADYALAPQTTLSFEGVAGFRRNDESEDLAQFVREGAARVGQRLTDEAADGLTTDGAVVLTRGFGAPAEGSRRGPQHELVAEVRASRVGDDRSASYLDRAEGEADDRERLADDETALEAHAKADYTRPFPGGRLEVGSKLTQRTVDGEQVYEVDAGGGFAPDPRRTNAFDYDERVAAAYVQGARSLGSFEAQLGVRVEHTARTFTLAQGPPPIAGIPPVEGDPEADYLDVFPSAFLSRAFGRTGTSIRASYSRRIGRPQISQLNPFPTFEDTLTVTVGNPGLQPQYTNSFELTFRYKYGLSLQPFYRRTTDPVRRLLLSADNGVRVFTLANLDLQEALGAEVSYFGTVGPVRGYVSATASKRTSEGTALGAALGSDAVDVTALGNVRFEPFEGNAVQIYGYYRGPRETETGRLSAFGIVSAGLSQTFSPALSLSVRINDIFSTSEFVFESSDGERLLLRGVRDPEIQQVIATLTYTFGGGTKRDAPERPEEANDGGFGF